MNEERKRKFAHFCETTENDPKCRLCLEPICDMMAYSHTVQCLEDFEATIVPSKKLRFSSEQTTDIKPQDKKEVIVHDVDSEELSYPLNQKNYHLAPEHRKSGRLLMDVSCICSDSTLFPAEVVGKGKSKKQEQTALCSSEQKGPAAVKVMIDGKVFKVCRISHFSNKSIQDKLADFLVSQKVMDVHDDENSSKPLCGNDTCTKDGESRFMSGGRDYNDVEMIKYCSVACLLSVLSTKSDAEWKKIISAHTSKKKEANTTSAFTARIRSMEQSQGTSTSSNAHDE